MSTQGDEGTAALGIAPERKVGHDKEFRRGWNFRPTIAVTLWSRICLYLTDGGVGSQTFRGEQPVDIETRLERRVDRAPLSTRGGRKWYGTRS